MPGVIDVLDSVSGQLLIKTQGKSYLNFNSQAIQSIRIAACRAIFTPTDFRPDVQIEGLSVSGNSYILLLMILILFQHCIRDAPEGYCCI